MKRNFEKTKKQKKSRKMINCTPPPTYEVVLNLHG
jgi:hypothetical protein